VKELCGGPAYAFFDASTKNSLAEAAPTTARSHFSMVPCDIHFRMRSGDRKVKVTVQREDSWP
jgi:hypothetical protein